MALLCQVTLTHTHATDLLRVLAHAHSSAAFQRRGNTALFGLASRRHRTSNYLRKILQRLKFERLTSNSCTIFNTQNVASLRFRLIRDNCNSRRVSGDDRAGNNLCRLDNTSNEKTTFRRETVKRISWVVRPTIATASLVTATKT